MTDPDVLGRLSHLEGKLDTHTEVQTKAMWESGQAWGKDLEAALADHETRIGALEGRIDPVMGS